MEKEIYDIIEDVANERGISVYDVDHRSLEFSFYTSAGQDFCFEAEYMDKDMTDADGMDMWQKLLESIDDYQIAFDPVAEAMLWVDEDGQGKNGAPGDIRDIIKDMEEAEQTIVKFYGDLLDNFYARLQNECVLD